MTNDMETREQSPLFRNTKLCLMILGCICLGAGGGFMLKLAFANGGGKLMAMAFAIIAVSALSLVLTVKELLRKQK